MQGLIRELRRRAVFRTAGLYVGISWIAIEASSVLLPAFDAPDWVMRAIIIIAFIGFPITIVLSWVFEITDRGIEVQGDPTDTMVVPFGGRKTDFVVIGILSVALVFSIYLNITGDPPAEVERELVSLLIADFDNQTGDPLFDESIEQALSIGLEGAAFVTAFSRPAAERLLEELLRPGSSLDEEGACLVSIREGIKLVVSGSIAARGNSYEITARMVNPGDAALIEEFRETAGSKLEVLATVGTLAEDIREELGDTSVDEAAEGETFTAASLEAVKLYTQAQALSSSFKFEEAVDYYAKAVAEDPNFGRAYSGWALALFNLSKEEEANERWQMALSKMNTMTERERYRTLGLYYVAVTGDFEKGVDSYQTLVEKYPADNMGYNNLAVAHFMTLNFADALEATRLGLEIYPSNRLMMSNRALLAMYASDLDHGSSYAQDLLEMDAGMVLAWIPVAIAALAKDEFDKAAAAYANMAKVSSLGESISNLGLADMHLYRRNFEAAVQQLEQGIDADMAGDFTAQLAAKYVALAEAKHGLGDVGGATEALQQGLEVSQGVATRVPAALLSIELGDTDLAAATAESLSQELQPMSRAYGQAIKAAIASSEGRHAEALDAVRAGIDLADLWLLRFYLGRTYFEAGRFIEALDEFQVCRDRRGEAAAMFLDEKPTWHYIADLNEWISRARQELDTSVAAGNAGG